MGNLHSGILVTVMALGTVLLRALPFLIFSGDRTPPKYIVYLGEVLPPAAISMLVIYCFKSISFVSAPFGLPELIAGALTVGLQIWRRNSILSIFSGTLVYMLLIQLVFK